MSKHKHQNHYGTFGVKQSGYKKITRNFVAAFTAVIFIFGLGLYVFKLGHKPVKQSETVAVADSEIPGWWNEQYFNVTTCDKDFCKPESDPDNDKLTNLQEFYYHTNPLNVYTMGDKLNDGELVAQGFDPSKPGHVTFDQVATPENLLGESLVFGEDIKQIVADEQDISKVNLPLVKDDELKIVYGEDATTYKTYASKLQQTITKYFRSQDVAQIKEILKSGSDDQVMDISTKAAALAAELKTVTVPLKLVTFHKYNIVMFQLLSEIVPPPADMSGAGSDVWYQKVQAFLAVQQKLGFEEQALNK